MHSLIFASGHANDFGQQIMRSENVHRLSETQKNNRVRNLKVLSMRTADSNRQTGPLHKLRSGVCKDAFTKITDRKSELASKRIQTATHWPRTRHLLYTLTPRCIAGPVSGVMDGSPFPTVTWTTPGILDKHDASSLFARLH